MPNLPFTGEEPYWLEALILPRDDFVLSHRPDFVAAARLPSAGATIRRKPEFASHLPKLRTFRAKLRRCAVGSRHWRTKIRRLDQRKSRTKRCRCKKTRPMDSTSRRLGTTVPRHQLQESDRQLQRRRQNHLSRQTDRYLHPGVQIGGGHMQMRSPGAGRVLQAIGQGHHRQV